MTTLWLLQRRLTIAWLIVAAVAGVSLLLLGVRLDTEVARGLEWYAKVYGPTTATVVSGFASAQRKRSTRSTQRLFANLAVGLMFAYGIAGTGVLWSCAQGEFPLLTCLEPSSAWFLGVQLAVLDPILAVGYFWRFP